MTKRNLSLMLVLVAILGAIIFLSKNNNSPLVKKTPEPALELPVIDSNTLTIDGKKVLGLPPGIEKKEIQKLKIANKVTSDWEPNLEKSIRAQGGGSVKDIAITKVDSFVWNQDGVALFVESVVVTIKNQKNEETSFKALVDSQNGKILKNWDQPIFDPVHPKDRYKVRIDPRYHNE